MAVARVQRGGADHFLRWRERRREHTLCRRADCQGFRLSGRSQGVCSPLSMYLYIDIIDTDGRLYGSSTGPSLMASSASKRRTRLYFGSCARRARITKNLSLRRSSRDSKSQSTGSLKTITGLAPVRSRSMERQRQAGTLSRPRRRSRGTLSMAPLLCNHGFFVSKFVLACTHFIDANTVIETLSHRVSHAEMRCERVNAQDMPSCVFHQEKAHC